MSSVIEVKGVEQAFTSANTFSTANSTQVEGWNLVRILNVGTTVGVITVNYANGNANCSIAGGGELFVQKPANTTLTASSANLLGVSVAYKNN